MKEVSEKHMKKIYLNILKAIVVVTYFLTLNLVSERISALYLERGIEICTMIFLFIAIFIFELAYKKDDDDLALQGIEVLVLSAYTLTSQYITKRFNFNFKSYSLAASYIIAAYFLVKCIWVYTKGRKEMADDLSDIKEIVKEEEPVKKEATKKNTAKATKESAEKKTTTKKIKTEETENRETKSKTTKAPAKRKTTTKKIEKEGSENKEIKSKTTKAPAKRKTATKKIKTEETENKETKSKTTKAPAKKKTTKKKVDEEK